MDKKQMMDGFYGWISSCYQDDEIEMLELKTAMKDPKSAYRLFIEYLDHDPEVRQEIGREAQEELRLFLRHLIKGEAK